MKFLNDNVDIAYKYDCKRIQKCFLEEFNIFASLNDCYSLWKNYSDSYAASWMGLPDNDEELKIILENAQK